MYIQSLSYFDKDTNWTLSHTEFDVFTLFVGISGVGKSKILEAMMSLRRVVVGDTKKLGGVGFCAKFKTEHSEYEWQCQFERLFLPNIKSCHASALYPQLGGVNGNIFPAIETESLLKDGVVIFKRNKEGCVFKGATMPHLSRTKSVMELFGEEEEILDVRRGCMDIFLLQFTNDMNILVENSFVRAMEQKATLYTEKEVTTSEIPIIAKLAYVYLKNPEKFKEIKEKFIDIFPQVQDVLFREEYDGRYFVLFIKENNTDYIEQGNLSSGMLKTLLFISQLAMLDGKCVVLIDEIENSLGLNCIDILTQELASTNCDDQFFVTSHHPYIINNIDMDSWKVVMRNGSLVSVKTAKELNLGRSSHEAFVQLINSAQYSGGIQ